MDRLTPVAMWLRAARGTTSQAALVADLATVTGWNLLRENYSKYETGRMTPEPDTLARFIAYWASRGVSGPDLTPAEPTPDPMERIAKAVEDIARTLSALRGDMAEQRGETLGAIAHLEERLAASLGQIGDAR